MKVFALAWFVISVAIFFFTFIFAFKKHANLKAALKVLLLGTVLANFIILSSLFYFGNVYTKSGTVSEYNSATNKNVEKPFILLHGSEYEITTGNKTAFAVIYALINAPKVGTFGLKYPIFFAAVFDFPWNLGLLYGIYALVLSIVTPIVFGGFLVSYVKALWNLLLFHIRRRFCNIYYFSDLNEKSMLLAEDIAANEKHNALIVFCNCNKVSGSLEERIDKNHFIALSENECDLILRFSFGNKKQCFFEISDDDNKNLVGVNKTIERLLEVFRNSKKEYFPNLKVFLFMERSLFGSEQLFESDQKKINIILVDKIKTSIYNLLFEKPLCDATDAGNKSLSIAVFGNGVYSKEFFKNSIWASILDNSYKTKISYVDSTADSFKKSLELNCPGLFTQDYNLNFYATDLQSSELNVTLNKLKATNYIVIDTGDDETSINLAIYLRMFYIRNSADFNFKPFIAVRIKDSKMAKRINGMKTRGDVSYEIYSFGSDKEIYSYNLIVESPIEKLALNCHAAYKNETNEYESKEAAVFGCNISEFEKSSNRAAAVHIKNKLFLMGLTLKPYNDDVSEEDIKQNDKAVELIKNKVADEKIIEALQEAEHYRWNAFHFSAGWINPTLAKSKIYKDLAKSKTKSHKYELAKMHACLCSWEEMPALEKMYDKDFKYYDKIFIQGIPSIIGCRNNDPGNIAGAKFLLAERK
ncbi:MAG: hypothetical protein J6V90_07125 [Treponema sp.]|nr:hypothetical protein [Treponema sp.]